MTLKLTDVHCPNCGQKLCEEIEINGSGHVRFTCRRCKRNIVFKEGRPKDGNPTE